MNLRGASAVALVLAWPLVAHVAVTRREPRSAALWVLALISLPLLPALLRARPWAWLAWVAAALTLWALAHAHLATLPAYLLPALVPAAGALVFADSLRAGAEPLVTRFVRISEGAAAAADPVVRRYTRAVTRFWAWLLGALAALALGLALLAVPDGLLASFGIAPRWPLPRAYWSLWVNGLAYVVLALAFVLEYALRRRLLAHVPRRGFVAFLQELARHWPELRRSR
ncbi:MAG TPA: hypothetical protein VF216_05550 [Mizugakiibacter sp.]